MNAYDRLVWQASAAIILTSLILLIFNQLDMHYPVVNYPFAGYQQPAVFISLALYIMGCYIESLNPRCALICKTLGMISIASFVMLIADSGFFTTPFSLKDGQVLGMDSAVNFHLLAIVDYVHRHPVWAKLLQNIYLSMFAAIVLVPVLLASLNDRVSVYRFFLASLWACLIGFIIYYFFPTSDPAAVMNSPYFTRVMSQMATQFQLNHQCLTTPVYHAGFISLPSFHTIWAVLLIYACYRYKWLFVFVLMYSLTVIFSTFSTGWHFLMDDIAGFLVASLSWALAVKSTNLTKDNEN